MKKNRGAAGVDRVTLAYVGSPHRCSIARFAELLEPLDCRIDVREKAFDRRLHGWLGRVIGKRLQKVEPAGGHPRRPRSGP